MVSVKYALLDGYGEWVSVIGKGRLVEIDLGPGVTGRLSLGGRECPLEGGRARISTVGLTFGEYPLTLIEGERLIPLEPLVIEGERVTPAPTADAVIRRALGRQRQAEQNIKNLEERIKELEALVKGSALFG